MTYNRGQMGTGDLGSHIEERGQTRHTNNVISFTSEIPPPGIQYEIYMTTNLFGPKPRNI